MDLLDLDDVMSVAEKRMKASFNPGERYRKAVKKEYEKPKKAFSYYKDLYRPPPGSMVKKGIRGEKIPPKIAYAALSTLGMARCSILIGNMPEARKYGHSLSCYPDPSVKASGEAILHYLDGNTRTANQALQYARQGTPFAGEVLAHYLTALDMCSQLLNRPQAKQQSMQIPTGSSPKMHSGPRNVSNHADTPGPEQTGPPSNVQQQVPSRHVHHHHVVVQNIGEYIAGGKVDIRDSVVNRSQMGNTTNGGLGKPHNPQFNAEVDMSDRTTVLDEYRKLLESVWEDGIVSDEEFAFLQRIRKHEGITMTEHLEVEMEIRNTFLNAETTDQHSEEDTYPCPSCGNILEYSDEYDNWYCWTCEDYKY